MTKRQITSALKNIDKARKEGYLLEALVMNYHLNISLLKYISHQAGVLPGQENEKPKVVLNKLMAHLKQNGSAKQVISKKNLKSLKPWLNKMDVYFKTLRSKKPSNTKSLLAESEKIFTLLNIPLAKIHAHK